MIERRLEQLAPRASVSIRRRRRRRPRRGDELRAQTTRSSSRPARACRATCRSPAASSTASTSRWSTSTAQLCVAATAPGAPAPTSITAAGKHVIVIGGGDTGADCVGNAHREGAASVTQIELLGEPPAHAPGRPHAVAALADEAAPPLRAQGGRRAATSRSPRPARPATAGSSEIHWIRTPAPAVRADRGHRGEPPGRPRAARDGLPRARAAAARRARRREATRAATRRRRAYATSADGVFAAGDARRGQSLIVWAINEGRRLRADGRSVPEDAAGPGRRLKRRYLQWHGLARLPDLTRDRRPDHRRARAPGAARQGPDVAAS